MENLIRIHFEKSVQWFRFMKCILFTVTQFLKYYLKFEFDDGLFHLKNDLYWVEYFVDFQIF